MKPFFTDRQVRKFTLKEKFEYIFKRLNTILQPITEKRTEAISYAYNKHKRIMHLYCLHFNEDGVPLINSIELPFDGMEVKTKKELIQITGEKFSYESPPDMMPEIWRRLKKSVIKE